MSWSPRDERAINHYMKQNNLRLELQSHGHGPAIDVDDSQLGLIDVPPTEVGQVHFIDKATGERVSADLDLLLIIYDEDRKSRTRERVRAKRLDRQARRRVR